MPKKKVKVSPKKINARQDRIDSLYEDHEEASMPVPTVKGSLVKDLDTEGYMVTAPSVEGNIIVYKQIEYIDPSDGAEIDNIRTPHTEDLLGG